MDRRSFQELQYRTLRTEIENGLERVFKIMVGGATLIPILVGIAGHYSATPILMALPLTAVVTALLYLNQWNGIMRCGCYIRTKIEPEVIGSDGWEAWLESPSPSVGRARNRLVDDYLTYAFYLLSAAYYVAASYIAFAYGYTDFGPLVAWPALGAYLMIGAVMGTVVVRQLSFNTALREERLLVGARASAESQPASGELLR